MEALTASVAWEEQICFEISCCFALLCFGALGGKGKAERGNHQFLPVYSLHQMELCLNHSPGILHPCVFIIWGLIGRILNKIDIKWKNKHKEIKR
jgi:hypothetical protein